MKAKPEAVREKGAPPPVPRDQNPPCAWPVDESGAAWSRTGAGVFQLLASLRPADGPGACPKDKQSSRC